MVDRERKEKRGSDKEKRGREGGREGGRERKGTTEEGMKTAWWGGSLTVL
jgi:hypothetical protein